MKLKSFFSRIPRWLILLVILAAFYFIFRKRKSIDGFAPCYKYYEKLANGICFTGIKYASTVPANGYSTRSCSGAGGKGSSVNDQFCRRLPQIGT